MKRIRWEVRPAMQEQRASKPHILWYAFRDGEPAGQFAQKLAAVRGVAERCRREWKSEQLLSELTIKRKDNVIQDKRTYGKDPRGTKG